MCQDAGATIFGPAVNIRTGKSCAWNAAYSIHEYQAVHGRRAHPRAPNVGEGVGGVPVNGNPPEDAASRAAQAHVDILKCDW